MKTIHFPQRGALLSCLWLAACARVEPAQRPAKTEVTPAQAGPAEGPAPAPGLKVAPGFAVTLFADATQADDIFSLTFDAHGDAVVSGAGYIKRLRDLNHDGRADSVQSIVATKSGSMGLTFDGDDLYSFHDGALWKIAGAGTPLQQAPQQLMKAQFGEHGGHVARVGPDGQLYFLASNSSKVAELNSFDATSPIRHAIGGALVALGKDGSHPRIVADGFRNPYRFDFTAGGDSLVYDSDGERDYSLPWYTPTRLHHVAYAGHHGWLLPGWQRTFARLDVFADVPPLVARLGLGSPTAVVVYRHNAFPARFTQGVFLADWTFGRLSFLPLQAAEGTYKAGALETIVEALGTDGFAPTDADVAPDGSLFVSIGGRGTRGGVYRIAWTGAAPTPQNARDDLTRVLQAPQPQSAWSRAIWNAAAQRLGVDAFAGAALDRARSVTDRVRAIEVAASVFAGLPTTTVDRLATDVEPQVRARVAWLMGTNHSTVAPAICTRWLDDPDPRVRVAALEAMARRQEAPASALQTLKTRFIDSNVRARQAAWRLASLLPQAQWQQLAASVNRSAPTSETLALEIAAVWRTPTGRERGLADDEAAAQRVFDLAATALAMPGEPLRDDIAIRLLMFAMGEWKLEAPASEFASAYVARREVSAAQRARLTQLVAKRFTTGSPAFQRELARVAAMARGPARELAPLFAAQISEASTATDDAHYLFVIANLNGPLPASVRAPIAGAYLGLSQKLGPQAQRLSQNWPARVGEALTASIASDPLLAQTFVQTEAAFTPAAVPLLQNLPAPQRTLAARKLLPKMAPTGPFPWSEDIVQFVAQLPQKEHQGRVRALADTPDLRDAAVLVLAAHPSVQDRARFVQGLASFAAPVRDACVTALAALPPDKRPETSRAVALYLRKLVDAAAAPALRNQALALLSANTGQRFAVANGAQTRQALQEAYRPVFAWMAAHDADFASAVQDAGGDPAAWAKRLRVVNWQAGDAAKGKVLLATRACLSCHGGDHPLGPSLSGVTTRMSREDLLTAIAFPSADVAPAYSALQVSLNDQSTLTGLVVYEGPDRLILRTGPEALVRLSTNDIASRAPADTSMMPAGLLEGLSDGELADLFAGLAASASTH